MFHVVAEFPSNLVLQTLKILTTETDRQTDRQAGRQTATDRHTDRKGGKMKDTTHTSVHFF